MASEEGSGLSADHAKRKFALNTFNKSLKKQKAQKVLKPADKFGSLIGLDLSKMPFMVNPFVLVPPDSKDFESYTSGYGSLKKSYSVTTISSSSSSSSYESASSTVASSTHSTRRSSLGDDSLKHSEIESMVASIVDDVITSAVERANQSSVFDESDVAGNSNFDKTFLTEHRNPLIQPLHTHLLLYTQVSDSSQILFAMQCIKHILQTNPRQSIGTMAATILNSVTTPRRGQLQVLLARHRKSVFGKSFVGTLQPENMTTYRSSTLIEVLMSTLLYFLRSFYPNLGHAQVREEIRGNREVQLMSINLIIALVSELALMVRDNGRAFATFIFDLFERCKVHKVVLHTLLASVTDTKDLHDLQRSHEIDFTDDVLLFNEVYADGNETNTSEKISNYSEAFQIQLLRLLLALVTLEQIVIQQKGESNKNKSSEINLKANVIRYLESRVIPEQPMFLAAINTSLGQPKIRHLHSHWTSLVTSCLPFLGGALQQTVSDTVGLLSINIESISKIYSCDDFDQLSELGLVPMDYILTQLDALTVIYHYALGEAYAQVNLAFASPFSNQASVGLSANSVSSEIMTNLRHVILSTFDQKNLVAGSSNPDMAKNFKEKAKEKLLAKLPRMILCCIRLWMNIKAARHDRPDSNTFLIGDPQVVKNRLISFLSPVGQCHQGKFVSAIGVAWQELKQPNAAEDAHDYVVPPCSPEQEAVVELVSKVPSLPVSTLLEYISRVMKSPPNIEGGSTGSIEIALLQFLYFYLKQCTTKQVLQSWVRLSSLMRDCVSMAPPVVFLAVAILNQFCTRHLSGDSEVHFERKDYKEVQDISAKLFDECAKIAGSYLEQTRWLKKTMKIRYDLQKEAEESKISGFVEEVVDPKMPVHFYAVPALILLSRQMASVLETVFQSDEKDKANSILGLVLTMTLPYLHAHCRYNRICFCASSKLLASISGYQVMRKSWKKEALELLLDPAFFQMDHASLKHWKITIDNLMAQDNFESFGKFFAEVCNPNVGLLASKDQELEQQTMLIKRLAFAFLCSDVDQYEKFMDNKEIINLLGGCLKANSITPELQCSIFFCFRVILLRFSARNLGHMWSVIINEMVQIFATLERELLDDSEKARPLKMSALLKKASTDSNWLSNATDLSCKSSPQYLAVFLAVCKVVDLCLALPASRIPQSELYIWGFVNQDFGPSQPTSEHHNGAVWIDPDAVFIPYIVRIAQKFLDKFGRVEPVTVKRGQLLLTMKSIHTLEDLAPFLSSLVSNVSKQQAVNFEDDIDFDESDIVTVIEEEFLEQIPK